MMEEQMLEKIQRLEEEKRLISFEMEKTKQLMKQLKEENVYLKHKTLEDSSEVLHWLNTNLDRFPKRD